MCFLDWFSLPPQFSQISVGSDYHGYYSPRSENEFNVISSFFGPLTAAAEVRACVSNNTLGHPFFLTIITILRISTTLPCQHNTESTNSTVELPTGMLPRENLIGMRPDWSYVVRSWQERPGCWGLWPTFCRPLEYKRNSRESFWLEIPGKGAQMTSPMLTECEYLRRRNLSRHKFAWWLAEGMIIRKSVAPISWARAPYSVRPLQRARMCRDWVWEMCFAWFAYSITRRVY